MLQPGNERDVSSTVGRQARKTQIGTFRFASAALLLGACAGPTDSGQKGDDTPHSSITLQVSAPATVLVHEHALLTVRALDERGVVVDLPQPVAWNSSDQNTVTVTSSGIVTGRARGNAVITVRAGSATAAISLNVRARVRIALGLSPDPWWFDGAVVLAVGDSLQFSARYVDFNGVPIDESPSATWTSSNPGSVDVSASGIAVAFARADNASIASITASTADGLASMPVWVSDAIAGQPATIRFVHAVRDADPITFSPSKGSEVTLSFGESLERPIPSGMFYVEASGFPPSPGRPDQTRKVYVIAAGARLTLYAVRGYSQNFLTPVWTSPASVSPDSGLVRFVQSSEFSVVYLRPPGAPVSGLPELCYFDPGDPTNYFRRTAGQFDILLRYKGVGSELARFPAMVPAGGAVTYVIIGDTPQTAAVLAFPDF